MDIVFCLALYFMIWWMCLFAVLPIGMRTQGESGDVVPGTPASAPTKPKLKKLFLINSWIPNYCELIVVGKTVESYRMALEGEISRWNGFVRALRKDDREAFEEMIDLGRGFASEAGNATYLSLHFHLSPSTA